MRFPSFRGISRTLAATFVATAAVVIPQNIDGQPLREEDHTRYMLPLGDRTSKPLGHYDFCRIYAGECAEAEPDTLRLTVPMMRRLSEINNLVNTTVVSVTDQDNHNRLEVWDFAENGQGDCEEYMLLKRRALIAEGIPAGALLMAVGRQSNGQAHAVLIVNTHMGQLVLDNLSTEVRWIEDTNYTYTKASLGDHWYDFQRPDTTVAQGPA